MSLAPSTTVLMLGLPAGLRLVIDNAIANAVKHGGATEIRLSVVSSVEGVEIAVDDNGAGVPEEERAAVFERFARGIDRVAVGLRPGAGAGRPAGRTARRHRVAGRESAGRRPAAAAAAGPRPADRRRAALSRHQEAAHRIRPLRLSMKL